MFVFNEQKKIDLYHLKSIGCAIKMNNPLVCKPPDEKSLKQIGGSKWKIEKDKNRLFWRTKKMPQMLQNRFNVYPWLKLSIKMPSILGLVVAWFLGICWGNVKLWWCKMKHGQTAKC